MSLTKASFGKIAFSLLGVCSLALAGVTAYNYAATMEAYAFVELVPTAVEVHVDQDLVKVNTTYRITNPSRIEIEVIWAQALVMMLNGEGEYQFSNYKGFDAGTMKIAPGESVDFVITGYAKRSNQPETYDAVANRSADAAWVVFCSMYYGAVDFEFSTNRYDGVHSVREV